MYISILSSFHTDEFSGFRPSFRVTHHQFSIKHMSLGWKKTHSYHCYIIETQEWTSRAGPDRLRGMSDLTFDDVMGS